MKISTTTVDMVIQLEQIRATMSLNKDGDLEGILARPNIDVNF